jgi:hypothetical protein
VWLTVCELLSVHFGGHLVGVTVLPWRCVNVGGLVPFIFNGKNDCHPLVCGRRWWCSLPVLVAFLWLSRRCVRPLNESLSWWLLTADQSVVGIRLRQLPHA